MGKLTRRFMKGSVVGIALSLLVGLGMPSVVNADEADAKKLLKAMADYMVAQKEISFNFDATLEVVTTDDQTLALVSSGAVTMVRPDKIRATRAGGHADIEILFDGKMLTLFGKNLNKYTQVEMPGTIENLVETLQTKYDRPLPAADLLLPTVYDELMADVTNIKDLGSGVIEGVECDYLAFRKKDVDLQIWIAQGDKPYPRRYTITSKDVPHSPQYTIQVRDWKTGSEVAADDFSFKNTTDAKKVEPEDVKKGMSDLPENFKIGAEK